MGRDNTVLINGLASWGISCSEEQVAKLEKYYELLIEKNKVMNLTAITEYEDVLVKHFLDSLSLVKILPELKRKTGTLQTEQTSMIKENNLHVLDLGTGAGFPGIPLKIMFPELELTLMDSLNKRILFLQEVIDKLCLSGITAVHGRAEETAKKGQYREKFDLCVSRAVARLVSLSEFCLPFVKTGGYFVSYKSGAAEEEITEAQFAVSILGGKWKEKQEFVLPSSEISRTLILIEKNKKTPEKYPRAGGKPLKEPLI